MMPRGNQSSIASIPSLPYRLASWSHQTPLMHSTSLWGHCGRWTGREPWSASQSRDRRHLSYNSHKLAWGKKMCFQCMEVQRKGWQGGNLLKITFSMEIRAYLNWIETKILHWKQVCTRIFYPWLSADKRVLREDHHYNTEGSWFHLLAPVAKINPRPTLATPPQFYISRTRCHLTYGMC